MNQITSSNSVPQIDQNMIISILQLQLRSEQLHPVNIALREYHTLKILLGLSKCDPTKILKFWCDCECYVPYICTVALRPTPWNSWIPEGTEILQCTKVWGSSSDIRSHLLNEYFQSMLFSKCDLEVMRVLRSTSNYHDQRQADVVKVREESWRDINCVHASVLPYCQLFVTQSPRSKEIFSSRYQKYSQAICSADMMPESASHYYSQVRDHECDGIIGNV